MEGNVLNFTRTKNAPAEFARGARGANGLVHVAEILNWRVERLDFE